MTVEGDHRIREESVEVDRRIGTELFALHERQVTAASCPIRRASKVTENRCGLQKIQRATEGSACREPCLVGLDNQKMLFQRYLPSTFFTVDSIPQGSLKCIQQFVTEEVGFVGTGLFL